MNDERRPRRPRMDPRRINVSLGEEASRMLCEATHELGVPPTLLGRETLLLGFPNAKLRWERLDEAEG